jgi:transposase-like protein
MARTSINGLTAPIREFPMTAKKLAQMKAEAEEQEDTEGEEDEEAEEERDTPGRRYPSAEQRAEAVHIVVVGGASVPEAAEKMGVSKSALYRWVKEARRGRKGAGPKKGAKAPSGQGDGRQRLLEENRTLRAKLIEAEARISRLKSYIADKLLDSILE